MKNICQPLDTREESYPDITFQLALANIFETSIDLLIGMDGIRGAEVLHNIHAKASAYQRTGEYDLAVKIKRINWHRSFHISEKAEK